MSYPQPPHQQPDPGGQPYGAPPYQQPYQQPGWGTAPAGWGHAPSGPPGPPRRPGTVLAGAIMTYIGAALLIVVGAVLAIGSGSASFREGFGEGAGILDVPAGVVAGIGIVFAVIGIVLVALAVLTQRGSNGARIALTVIGGVFVLLQLVGIATGGAQAVVGLVWIVTAVALLWAGGSSAWFRLPRS